MQMDGFLTLKGGNVELVGAPETIFVDVYKRQRQRRTV